MAVKLSRSASTTSRWPLAPRNASATSQPANARQAASAVSACSAVNVKRPPVAVWPVHANPAVTAAKTSHTQSASAAPHTPSRLNASIPCTVKGKTVLIARPGTSTAASTAARNRRIRSGRRPGSGSGTAHPARRAKANSQAARLASLSGIGHSLDKPREVGQQHACKLDQLPSHPVAQYRQHDQHDDELGNEGQRRLEDLRGSLEQADCECGQQPRQQQRRGDQHHQPERVAREAFHQKLPVNEPTSRCQPSTETNSSSFKGSDTSWGGSMIMPSAVSTAATTRSITRKGSTTMKPIWNAVFNSLVRKAGASAASGTLSTALGSMRLSSAVNRPRSSARVCRSMKLFSGVAAFSAASLRFIVPAR